MIRLKNKPVVRKDFKWHEERDNEGEFQSLSIATPMHIAFTHDELWERKTWAEEILKLKLATMFIDNVTFTPDLLSYPGSFDQWIRVTARVRRRSMIPPWDGPIYGGTAAEATLDQDAPAVTVEEIQTRVQDRARVGIPHVVISDYVAGQRIPAYTEVPTGYQYGGIANGGQ
jgi:hypothetical protein